MTSSGNGALLRQLWPQIASVAIAYCVVGASLAAVPLFVARELGQGASVIGLITGAQFLVGVVTRVYAGTVADRIGPKRVIVSGLWQIIIASAIKIAALFLVPFPSAAIAVLIAGRVLLGIAEGYVMVGAQSWALAQCGPGRSGMVIGWVGTALFGAMALGAPIGGGLYALGGYAVVVIATTLLPLPILIVVNRLSGVHSPGGQSMKLAQVLKRLIGPCTALALIGFCYGSIVSFCVLLFETNGWRPVWLGLTLFSSALLLARIFAGSLPDRLGGKRAGLWSLSIMVCGYFLIGFATHQALALIGAFIAGAGYALVYPSITRESLSRVPDRNRGAVMAVTSSAATLSLGLGGPFMGLLAEAAGTASVFVFAGAMAICAMVVVAMMRPAPKP